MTKAQQAEQIEAIEKLREWIKPGDTVYTILDHVSRSGMRRHIRVVVPYLRDDGTVDHVHPNYLVAQAIGSRQAKGSDGIVCDGCGMDMGFHLVYNLARAMWPNGFGCVGKQCHSNDHSNGDHDRTPNRNEGTTSDAEGAQHEVNTHWHRDGGYALLQRWL